jgi:hypothetical protein
VFCIHGNEVDPWNFVRYEDLSKLSRRLNSGRTLDASEWEPNAGTKIVKDVMNEIKRRYAWVDLMKPETQASVGVLLVLDPAQATKITRLPSIAGEFVQGATQFQGRLGGESFATAPRETRVVPVDQLLGANVAAGLRLGTPNAQASSDTLARDMLLQAERSEGAPRSVGAGGAAVQPAMQNETLGLPRLVWDRLTGWITGVGKDEALRCALQDWLANDKTFEFTERDYTFNHVTQTVGNAVDFIVTGHTHLHRAIDMGGGRYYFNTGTWIRLLRFNNDMLKDKDSFAPVFDILENGRMSAIDSAKFGNEPFVLDRTSTVRIMADATGVKGSLATVTGTDTIQWNEIQSFRRP